MLPISISCGDPCGIGYEILLKSWLFAHKSMRAKFFAIGSYEVLDHYNKSLNLKIPLNIINHDDLLNNSIQPESLNIFQIKSNQTVKPGYPCSENAPGIIENIETAIELIYKNLSSAIVTCPISKELLYKAGFNFPGHTEFLAHLARKREPENKNIFPVMLLKSPQLAVVPATIHIALKMVPQHLNSQMLIQTILTTYKDFKAKFAIDDPHIAVTGLNPHAGENGTLGEEESQIIQPAIDFLSQQKIKISGPFPADTIFCPQARRNYDVIICMYHDQALIPIKMLDFSQAVNITLGLPFIRTSPDHGTAFDIAGKNIACHKSLSCAITTAINMTQQLKKT